MHKLFRLFADNSERTLYKSLIIILHVSFLGILEVTFLLRKLIWWPIGYFNWFLLPYHSSIMQFPLVISTSWLFQVHYSIRKISNKTVLNSTFDKNDFCLIFFNHQTVMYQQKVPVTNDFEECSRYFAERKRKRKI